MTRIYLYIFFKPIRASVFNCLVTSQWATHKNCSACSFYTEVKQISPFLLLRARRSLILYLSGLFPISVSEADKMQAQCISLPEISAHLLHTVLARKLRETCQKLARKLWFDHKIRDKW